MSTNFKVRKFSEIGHDDSFFDPLKSDYPVDGTCISFVEWKKNNGYWLEGYPTNSLMSNEQFKKLLKEDKADVSNVIID